MRQDAPLLKRAIDAGGRLHGPLWAKPRAGRRINVWAFLDFSISPVDDGSALTIEVRSLDQEFCDADISLGARCRFYCVVLDVWLRHVRAA